MINYCQLICLNISIKHKHRIKQISNLKHIILIHNMLLIYYFNFDKNICKDNFIYNNIKYNLYTCITRDELLV